MRAAAGGWLLLLISKQGDNNNVIIISRVWACTPYLLMMQWSNYWLQK
jgi:hypothetical protein